MVELIVLTMKRNGSNQLQFPFKNLQLEIYFVSKTDKYHRKNFFVSRNLYLRNIENFETKND